MTITVHRLADDIVQHMRRHNRNVLTLRWPDFYKLCERDRLRKGFTDALAAQLAESSIVMSQGVAIVAFVNDYDFAPYRDVAQAGA